MVSRSQGWDRSGPARSQHVVGADRLLLAIHELHNGEAALCVANDKTYIHACRGESGSCDNDKISSLLHDDTYG